VSFWKEELISRRGRPCRDKIFSRSNLVLGQLMYSFNPHTIVVDSTECTEHSADTVYIGQCVKMHVAERRASQFHSFRIVAVEMAQWTCSR